MRTSPTYLVPKRELFAALTKGQRLINRLSALVIFIAPLAGCSSENSSRAVTASILDNCWPKVSSASQKRLFRIVGFRLSRAIKSIEWTVRSDHCLGLSLELNEQSSDLENALRDSEKQSLDAPFAMLSVVAEAKLMTEGNATKLVITSPDEVQVHRRQTIEAYYSRFLAFRRFQRPFLADFYRIAEVTPSPFH
jgi:hypothetical protein